MRKLASEVPRWPTLKSGDNLSDIFLLKDQNSQLSEPVVLVGTPGHYSSACSLLKGFASSDVAGALDQAYAEPVMSVGDCSIPFTEYWNGDRASGGGGTEGEAARLCRLLKTPTLLTVLQAKYQGKVYAAGAFGR